MIYPIKIERPVAIEGQSFKQLRHVETIHPDQALKEYWKSCPINDDPKPIDKRKKDTCQECQFQFIKPKGLNTKYCLDCRILRKNIKAKEDRAARIEAKPQHHCVICEVAIPKESCKKLLCGKRACKNERNRLYMEGHNKRVKEQRNGKA